MLKELIGFASLISVILTSQKFIVEPTDSEGIQGETIVIPCVVEPPHGDVQWTKDSIALGYDRDLPGWDRWRIIGNESKGEHNLEIRNVQISDEGTFACEVSKYQRQNQLKSTAVFTVLVKPVDILINGEDADPAHVVMKVKYNETKVRARCEVTGAKPPANVLWLDTKGNELSNVNVTTKRNADETFDTCAIFEIEPSMPMDKSIFQCVAMHRSMPSSPLKGLLKLSVSWPPSEPVVTHSVKKSFAVAGDIHTFSCITHGGNPLPTVQWYKNDTLIDSSFSIVNDLTINNYTWKVEPSDNEAVYSCRVMNQFLKTSLTKTISFAVNFGPENIKMKTEDDEKSKSLYIELNEVKTIVCDSSPSRPKASISWKLDGKSITNTSHKVIPSAYGGYLSTSSVNVIGTKDLDGVTISCNAKNRKTGQTKVALKKLYITYDSDSIRIEGYSSGEQLKVGTYKTLKCIAEGGNPKAEILWYQDNRLVPSEYQVYDGFSESTYKVEVTTKENGANVTCVSAVQGKRKFPQKSTSVVLNVCFPPNQVKFSQTKYSYEVGDTVSLFCSSSLSNPAAHIVFLLEDKNGERMNIPSGHLKIQRVGHGFISHLNATYKIRSEKDHGKRIFCQAYIELEGEALSSADFKNLNVNHKPYFLNTPNIVNVTEGDDVTLGTMTRAFPEEIEYEWYMPSNKRIYSDSKFSILGRSMKIKNVKRSEAGYYISKAINALGHTKYKIFLNVLYPPTIVYISPDSLINPGATAELLCKAESNPVTNEGLRWTRNGRRLSPSEKFHISNGKGESHLRITKFERSDSGLYECIATNELKSAKALVRLTAKSPPVIRKESRFTKYAVEGKKKNIAELKCVIDAIPSAKIVWKINDREIKSDNKAKYKVLFEKLANETYISTLYVRDLCEEDFRMYTCYAKNEIGFDEAQIELTGLRAPHSPSNLKVVNTTFCSITLQWDAGFNGGLPQFFRVRYRTFSSERYSYEDTAPNVCNHEVTRLELGTKYFFSIMALNEIGKSEWYPENELSASTSRDLPAFNSFSYQGEAKFPVIVILAVCGISSFLLLFSVVFITYFVHRRKKRSEIVCMGPFSWTVNGSTTNTNETEANTVDLLSNNSPYSDDCSPTYPFGTYYKYDEDEQKKPMILSAHDIQVQKPETEKYRRSNPIWASLNRNHENQTKNKEKFGWFL